MAAAGIGHNGGPVFDEPRPAVKLYLGEKFLRLFGPERHKAYYGGRGSGKSHAIATVYPLKMAQRTIRLVCARQYQVSIKDSVKELLEQKIKMLGLASEFLIYEREIVHKYTESRATFIGLDRNPDSAKSLEGADSCWVEEARTINARSMEILIPTIRKPGSELVWSWNPENRDDPVDHYFRGNGKLEEGEQWYAPPNSAIIQVGIEDNPWFYQTAMPQEMWHLMQGNNSRYRHVWLGEYDDTYDTKVFTNVEIGRVDFDLLGWTKPRYGMDFGFGSDPSAVVKVYINNLYRVIYVAREFCGHIAIRDLTKALDLVIDSREDEVFADSSQPGTIDHLVSQGYNVVGAKKGPGSLKAGINWLQSYKIVLDPSCAFFRDEARLYSWQVDRMTRKPLPIPVDANNHLWDALRYATEDAQTEGNVPDETGGVIRFKLGR
jgi:phage terminase large subunit